VKKSSKNNLTKVYCEKCDLVLESREKFEIHLDSHSGKIACEVCPIDTAIAKFVNLFKRKSSHNLE
jgi:RNase P subunit RPR2